MLNDQEASLLRNLENRRQRVIDAQDAIVAKLGEAVDHLDHCAGELNSGVLSAPAFSQAVVQWYALVTLLVERAVSENSEFSRVAGDFDLAELDECEPGGYIAERRNLIDAARDLAARTALYQNAVIDVFTAWKEAAGISADGGAA